MRRSRLVTVILVPFWNAEKDQIPLLLLRLSLSPPKYRRCERARSVPDLIHLDNDRGEVVDLALATRKTANGLTNPFSNLVSRVLAVRAHVV
jgi:hypothetical protein